jgi:hypothetical protein
MAQYVIGDRVTQSQYGDGTVSSVNSIHTKIDFDLHGVRTFLSDRVVLTAATTPAPVKPVKKSRAKKEKAPA